jgi:hypothetical protein
LDSEATEKEWLEDFVELFASGSRDKERPEHSEQAVYTSSTKAAQAEVLFAGCQRLILISMWV